MNELVSIIIPIYKTEKYLHQCIDSVLNQDYSNLEIILVDDGSPDNCGLICDEYAEKDTRIKVLHKQNEGISAARNSGLDIAKGKFISFIDSDDYVSENYISIMLNEFNNKTIDLVICSYYLLYNNNGDETIKLPKEHIIQNNILSGTDLIINRFSRLRTPYTVPWNKLYKSELFNNLRFEPGVIHEDEFIYRSLMTNCKQVAIINPPLYYYRQREYSIMSNYSADNYKYHLLWMAQEIIYYKAQKLYKPMYALETILCYEYLLYKKDLDKKIIKDNYNILYTAMKDISTSNSFPLKTRLHYIYELITLTLTLRH